MCTGFAIVIINSIMAIYMIVKAKKNLKKLENKVAVNDTIRMYKKGKIKMYKIVHDISP